MAEVHDEASEVSAEGGTVIVDGPQGIALTLTPDAAVTTADRLTDAAAIARTQPVVSEPPE